MPKLYQWERWNEINVTYNVTSFEKVKDQVGYWNNQKLETGKLRYNFWYLNPGVGSLYQTNEPNLYDDEYAIFYMNDAGSPIIGNVMIEEILSGFLRNDKYCVAGNMNFNESGQLYFTNIHKFTIQPVYLGSYGFEIELHHEDWLKPYVITGLSKKSDSGLIFSKILNETGQFNYDVARFDPYTGDYRKNKEVPQIGEYLVMRHNTETDGWTFWSVVEENSSKPPYKFCLGRVSKVDNGKITLNPFINYESIIRSEPVSEGIKNGHYYRRAEPYGFMIYDKNETPIKEIYIKENGEIKQISRVLRKLRGEIKEF